MIQGSIRTYRDQPQIRGDGEHMNIVPPRSWDEKSRNGTSPTIARCPVPEVALIGEAAALTAFQRRTLRMAAATRIKRQKDASASARKGYDGSHCGVSLGTRRQNVR